MRWSLVFNKATGWKISQNSQANTCVRTLLLIELQVEKCPKSTKKYLCRSLVFNKLAGWKNSQNSQKNVFPRVLFLIKLQAGFTRKHQCWINVFNNVFNRVISWENSKSSQESTTAGVSFSIKLQAKKFTRKQQYRRLNLKTLGTASTSNRYNKTQAFCTIYPVCSYS